MHPSSGTTEKRSGAVARRGTPAWLFNWDLWAGLLPSLGLAPMLAIQSASLWQRGYLFYLPLVVLVVAVMSARRWSDAPCKHPMRLWVAVAVMVMNVMLAAFSVWNYSPWLSHAAAIGVFFAWGLGRWGGVSWVHVAAISALLATTLPWPNGLDFQFNTWLNVQASSYAAAMFDAFSIPNLLTESKLKTEFLTIDIKSLGAYVSVFALFAISILLGIGGRRSFFHTLVLLSLSPLWFATSLSAGILASVCFQWEFGSTQEWLWFGVAVGALLLSDQFLSEMLQPVPLTEPEFGPLFFVINRMLCWPHEGVLVDTPPEDPEEKAIWEQIRSQTPSEERVSETDWFELRHAKWLVRGAAVSLLLLAVLPGMLLVGGRWSREKPVFRTVAESELGAFFDVELGSENGLPKQLGAWVVVAFKELPTVEDRPASFEWKYNWRGQVVIASVAFPISNWSGRVEVDRFVDWKLDIEDVLQLPSSDWTMGFGQFTNAFGGRSYMAQTAMDDGKEPISIEAQERLTRAESGRAPILRMLSPQRFIESKLLYRITAVCETGVGLSEQEQLEFQRSFELFCQAVRGKLRAGQLQSLVVR